MRVSVSQNEIDWPELYAVVTGVIHTQTIVFDGPGRRKSQKVTSFHGILRF